MSYRNSKLKFLRYSFLLFSVMLIIASFIIHDDKILLLATVSVWMSNIFLSFEYFHICSIFMFFNITFFVFLLSKPVIELWDASGNWVQSDEVIRKVLICLFVSLISMHFGALVMRTKIENQIKYKRNVKIAIISNKKMFYEILQKISLYFYYLCAGCALWRELQKLSFMKGKGYLELFTVYEPNIPVAIRAFSSMMIFALCIFLATMPSKKLSFLPLSVYFLLGIPTVIIGSRGPIFTRGLFILIYYLIRDHKKKLYGHNEKKWIGILEKTALVVVLPTLLLFSSIYLYVRIGQTMSLNILGLFKEFFLQQGSSFDVLGTGIRVLPKLKNSYFLFGGIIDYWLYGYAAKLLFGVKGLGIGNTIEKALVGHSFSNAMSYAAYGDLYLKGNGLGSSFILEAYADGGLLGIIVFSFLLAIILLIMEYFLLEQKLILSIISLIGITNVFFIPRAAATDWILFLFTPQFWLALFICLTVSNLWFCKYRKYSCGIKQIKI